MLASNPIKE